MTKIINKLEDSINVKFKSIWEKRVDVDKKKLTSEAVTAHSNNSKKATKTKRNLIFWTTKRVKIIITPIISKNASTIKLEELPAPLKYIPKDRPKSHKSLTGIVKIVIITEKVNNINLLSDCMEKV